MKEGFDGMIRRAEEGLTKLTKKDPDFAVKREFYDAVLICHKAAKKYIARYEALAREKAAEEADPKRKEELLAMADNCHQIAGGPAQSFWQALQLFNFATTMTQIESNGHSISYGRMDQWLYPYYEKDIKEGKITKEFAQELLEVTFVKMNNPTKVRDGGTAKVRQGRGFGGECLTIGGMDKDGNDLTNDLTMMMLDASVHTRMMCPWLLVRMHEGTPYEVKGKGHRVVSVPDMAIRRSSTMRLRSRHLQERACRQRRQQIMQSLAALSLLSPVKSMAGMTLLTSIPQNSWKWY